MSNRYSAANIPSAANMAMAYLDATTNSYAVRQLPHAYAPPDPPASTYKDMVPAVTCSHGPTREPVAQFGIL